MLWATTPIVVGVMALLFGTLPVILGRKRGYLTASVFYWLAFGLAFPLVLVGPERLAAVARLALPSGGVLRVASVWLALLLPPLLAGLAVTRVRAADATLPIVLASAALALANGTAEELLWRAAPLAAFPDQPILAFVLPALGFAVWHLAPQIVLPSEQPGGVVAFVAGSLLLGLCWGWAAYATGSVALAVVSHVLTDFLGLGGFAYLRSRSGRPAALD